MNERSDLYYRYVYGDKDTWRLAWHVAGRPYAMPSRRPERSDGPTLFEFDFAGARLWEHRCRAKWRLPPESNVRVRGSLVEADCLALLADLARLLGDARAAGFTVRRAGQAIHFACEGRSGWLR